jgi:hypothetical protein
VGPVVAYYLLGMLDRTLLPLLAGLLLQEHFVLASNALGAPVRRLQPVSGALVPTTSQPSLEGDRDLSPLMVFFYRFALGFLDLS